MLPKDLYALLACTLLPVVAFGQSTVKAPATDVFRDLALVFERSETTYRMHADGTGERLVHVSMRVQSEGAARQFGVLSFAYASANETPHITLVRVHKADGSTVDTPVSEAIEMASAVTREAPLYSDLKEKHLPVRSLSVGDTLEYSVQTSIDKAEAPGQFWGANHFTPPGTVVVLAEELTLEVPKDKYVQVWSPNHKPTISEQDGMRRYVWNVAQLKPPAKADEKPEASDKNPAPKDPDEDTDGRKVPSVAWTTFHTWAEVGDWYRGLALGRAEPKEALRARADELTKDAKTPEEQVRAIYNFVSTRTRYVGIDFGVGRYQPHSAAEVLANQYGDCKDKDTLLEALLRAKGFVTAPALIGAGIVPVPEVPTPAVFNHVITTVNLPSGRIWLDSTPEVAPYQFLTAAIRDQQALVVPASAPATLERTPVAAPYPFEERFEAVGELDGEGKLTSKMTATYRSDDEVNVRALARSVAPAEWDKASQYVSSVTGFGGTTSKTSFKGVEDLNAPITMTYDYSRHPFGDWDNLRIVPLFPMMQFLALGTEDKQPEADIELGAPRKLVAVSHIQLPKGYHTDLPDPIHVKTDFAIVDKTYRFDGQEIVAERTITVLQKKLPKTEWKRYKQFTKDIGMDGESWIQLIKPPPPAQAAVSKTIEISPKDKGDLKTGSLTKTFTIQLAPPNGAAAKAVPVPLPDGETTPELLQHVRNQMQAGDLTGAVATLDIAKGKSPDEKYLWALYGSIAMLQRDYDEAVKDFQRELKNYPDNEQILETLAEVQNRNGDSTGARQTLRSFLDKHPDNLHVALRLAALQSNAQDNIGALKTLQAAAEQNPEDRNVRLQLSTALLRMDRKEEAAAAAKSVLDGTDDPQVLNSAAYVLSETGQNLAFAEEISRKSITKLEEQSTAISTAEVNSNAFAQSNLLIASWDTLGWILFREDKPKEALPWILAAWRNDLRCEIGDHLGQIYESLGDKDEAMKIYTLAQGSKEGGQPSAEVRKHLRDSLERLRNSGAKPGPLNAVDALQDSRNYKLGKVAGMSGWGTFRLQISAVSVVGVQQMSGEKKLAGVTDGIQKLKFPELVPPESRAHLLRSGVVSCSSSTGCELVLVPNSSLQIEQY